MIFYRRKQHRNRNQLLNTYTSLTSILSDKNNKKESEPTTNGQASNAKKINLKFLSTSKNIIKDPLVDRTMNPFSHPLKPSSPGPYLRRNTVTQLKKRTKKLELTQQSFQNLNISTTSWCLYDSISKKYLGFRQDCKREVASLTKIMTTILTLQMLDHFQTQNMYVRVTGTAQNLIGTTAMLKQGYWIKLTDLLYGAMLPSGNDAAHTLAQYMGYLLANYHQIDLTSQKGKRLDLTKSSTTAYVQQFLKAMNDKVRELDLTSTWFSNPHGLQNVLNTSSPKDMLKLSRYAIKNETFRKIVNTQDYYYQIFEDINLTKQHLKKWTNTNRLLAKGWEGVKTGHTVAAGYCLSSLRDGIFIVVLNCNNDAGRFSDTQAIFNWYQDHISLRNCKSVLTIRSHAVKPIHNTKTQGSI